MACSRCGSELTPGSLICGVCGAVVSMPEGSEPVGARSGSQAAERPSAPGVAVQPAASRSASIPPGATVSAKDDGGGRKRAYVLVAAAACVLVVLLFFFVAWPKWFRGDEKDLSGPEQTMNAFFQALVDGDAAAILSLMDPSAVEELKSNAAYGDYASLDEYMELILEQANPQGDLQITDLEYKAAIDGDNATVEITGGKALYTDTWGNQVTETPETGGVVFGQKAYRLRNIDGQWYIEPGI